MEEILKQINRQDFITTLFADGLLGIGLGIIFSCFVTWRISKSISDLDRTENRKEQRRAEIQKTIDYIHTLLEETSGMQSYLPNWRDAWNGGKKEIGLTTPFWDTVKLSGDLPRLLPPTLVKLLSAFYGDIAEARRGRDLIQQYFVSGLEKRNTPNEYEELIIASIERARGNLASLNTHLLDERIKLINELESLK